MSFSRRRIAPGPRAPRLDTTRKVELSRDGTRLAYSPGIRLGSTGSERKSPGSASGRSPRAGKLFRRDEEGGSFDHTTFSPDGRRLATAWGVSNGPPSERKHWVSSWDLETGRERLHLDVPNVDTLAFSPDGRRLAVGVSAAPAGKKRASSASLTP